MAASDVSRVIRRHGGESVATTLEEAMEQSTAWAKSVGGVVCVAGSIFLVGEVLERMEG